MNVIHHIFLLIQFITLLTLFYVVNDVNIVKHCKMFGFFQKCIIQNPKKLPIHGENHSYRITMLSDVEHHKALAEKHYKNVKRVQCISDYNMAVDNLSNLYDNVMNAQELEDEVKGSLKKLKESEMHLKKELKNVQDKMSEMKKEIVRAENRMLLCKAKMQKVEIKTAELQKLRPISQGTQMDEEVEDKDPDNISQPKNIVPIPDMEGDEAVKQLLESEGLVVVSESGVLMTPHASATTSNITMTSNVATTSNITVSGGTGLTAFGQNVPASVGNILHPQNVVTPQYTVITSSNVEGGEIIIQPSVTGQQQQQITPILLPGVINIPSQPTVINLTETSTSTSATSSTMPDEYKRTKYEDTLELKDLKPLPRQKAPKRFFCMKCLNKGVETGYPKRNDLVKHLTSCGMEKEKKHKCEYENCNAAYV